MEAWRARPRFVKYRLPQPLTGLGALSGNQWSLVLVPGWRELARSPLEEVCAQQYVACNEAVLTARARIEPGRWIEIAYEDVVAHPVEELRRLFEKLEVPFSPAAESYARDLARNIAATALTAPGAGKWREQNADAVERVLPLVAPTERALGYSA
jgi:hypothetical protein